LMLSESYEAATLIQGIIDSSANIIFGTTIDENMTEEVKITVIATGFTPLSEREEEKPITIGQAKEEPDLTLPPLLRKIESEEQKEQAVQEIISVTAVPEKPVVEEVVQVEEEVKEEPKGRELPAFMRKLFRK
ncbi:MAG: hypothetical protein J6Q32_04170, partial [Clostridia bacterium]|nr:hypothetical protein [Clostridia bacterium]